jgi:hypothetical protein
MPILMHAVCMWIIEVTAAHCVVTLISRVNLLADRLSTRADVRTTDPLASLVSII